MKILLKVSYVGTNFCGFQVQPGCRTVQQTLGEAVSAAFGCECDVTGCSRTDAGVHALGFVCAVTPHGRRGFDSTFPIPAARISRALGRHLPPDVAILGAAFVSDSFHPRYDAVKKEYVYRIYTGARDPFREGRALWRMRAFSERELGVIRECAEKYIGKHDFRAFMASGSSVKDTVRTVYSAVFDVCGDEARFTVSADGFLYNMVRIMVGTMLDCADEKLSPDDVSAALESGDRALLGRTAAPCGLYMASVAYPVRIDWQND